MKTTTLSIMALTFIITQNLQAAPPAAATAAPVKVTTTTAPIVPKIKKGEYAILLDDNYQVFTTTTYQKLELSKSCFKTAKPKCMAYSVSLEKAHPVKLKNSDANNFAAHNCANVGGKNLIALDHERNEYNFCRFSDGSMVTAWSMYYKTNPAPVVK